MYSASIYCSTFATNHWSYYRQYFILPILLLKPFRIAQALLRGFGLGRSVMWSETVGLRTRPVWDQKKSVVVLHTAVLVLVLQVWCYFVKHDRVTLVVIMILKDAATFQVLFIVSLFCAWNITTVEINSGVHLVII